MEREQRWSGSDRNLATGLVFLYYIIHEIIYEKHVTSGGVVDWKIFQEISGPNVRHRRAPGPAKVPPLGHYLHNQIESVLLPCLVCNIP